MGIRFRCQACEKKLNVKSFLGGKRGICPHCGAKIAIPPAEGAPPVSAATGNSSQAVLASSQAIPVTSVAEETAQTKGPSSADGGHLSTSAVEAYPPTAEEGPSVTLAAPEAKLPDPPAAAPHDALSEAPGGVWYVRPPSGGQYGPASAEYMRRWIQEGRVSGDSLVWRDGWADWQPASTVLAGLLPGQGTPGTIPAAGPTLELAAPGITAEDSGIAKRGKRRSRRHRKNFNLTIVAILCLLIVGLLLALIKVLMP